jgi:hypothetical protein
LAKIAELTEQEQQYVQAHEDDYGQPEPENAAKGSLGRLRKIDLLNQLAKVTLHLVRTFKTLLLA